MSVNRGFLVLALLAAVTSAAAAERRTAHTWQLEDGEPRPAATIEDARWLAGSWTGTAFGQRFEETWQPPSAGTMAGLFKLYGDNGVAFYEIMLLTVVDGTLELWVKHFNADFSAWEDKTDFVRFRLVRKTDGELHFGGLSFYRRGDDRIDAYIVMREGDEVTEEYLPFERRP
ncbi:MAG: DUF6265 family protein [Woeseiaceae bacterium]|nr:DUF6265 family protein [Woeseiaceae bacterium]